MKLKDAMDFVDTFDPKLNPSEKTLVLTLMFMIDVLEDDSVQVTLYDLSQACTICKRSVSRVSKRLKARNVLRVDAKVGDWGLVRPSVYRVVGFKGVV